MPTLGTTELLIILLIAIVIFGANKIPKLGKGLGEGIRNFKTSLKAGQDESQSKEGKG
jgi:sec-independent protein translocase protein TatA